MRNLKLHTLFSSVFLLSVGASAQITGKPNTKALVGSLNEWKDALDLIVVVLFSILAVIGAVHVGYAYLNTKDNADDLLKKWCWGLAIVALSNPIIKFFMG